MIHLGNLSGIEPISRGFIILDTSRILRVILGPIPSIRKEYYD